MCREKLILKCHSVACLKKRHCRKYHNIYMKRFLSHEQVGLCAGLFRRRVRQPQELKLGSVALNDKLTLMFNGPRKYN